MARTKEQHFNICIEIYPGGSKPPRVREKTFGNHKDYLHAMKQIADADAHMREETHTTVKLFGSQPQGQLFGGDSAGVAEPQVEPQVEPAPALPEDPAAEDVDYAALLKDFEEALAEAGAKYDTPVARATALKGVAEQWDGRLAGASEEEREPFGDAFAEAMQEAQASHDRHRERPTPYDPEDLAEENPAGDVAPRTELPEDFPHRARLEAAGITTVEGVLAAGSIDGLPALEDIDGIAEARARKVRSAAEELLE